MFMLIFFCSEYAWDIFNVKELPLISICNAASRWLALSQVTHFSQKIAYAKFKSTFICQLYQPDVLWRSLS